jgi:restriction endonuclease
MTSKEIVAKTLSYQYPERVARSFGDSDFVAETKGTDDINDLSLSVGERHKIKCGKRHFEQFKDIKFRAPVKSLKDVISG